MKCSYSLRTTQHIMNYKNPIYNLKSGVSMLEWGRLFPHYSHSHSPFHITRPQQHILSTSSSTYISTSPTTNLQPPTCFNKVINIFHIYKTKPSPSISPCYICQNLSRANVAASQLTSGNCLFKGRILIVSFKKSNIFKILATLPTKITKLLTD